MADTPKQSPLGINLLGSLLNNSNVFTINPKVSTIVGTSSSNESYNPGTIVTSSCLRLLTLSINDAYLRGIAASTNAAGIVYTDGTGQSATFDVTKESGSYNVAISDSGSNYSPGDTIVINAPEVNAPIVPVANATLGGSVIPQPKPDGIVNELPKTSGPWPNQTSWPLPLSNYNFYFATSSADVQVFRIEDPSTGESVFVPTTQIVTFAGETYIFDWQARQLVPTGS